MKHGSLVEYIGGQCEKGRRLCPLYKDIIYTVSVLCEGNFEGEWRPAVYLEETGNVYAFCQTLFRELANKESLDIQALLKESEQYSLQDLNT